ncbi:MAG: TIGR04438 family Trp-rich protein [Candidatus Obscuribacterales bacterium]|nr:TIGR04438 family Trp-rich protein [Candidatus Obscuribacterales bacterium]
MLLLIPVAILYALKLFEVSFMDQVSWWWVNGFAFLAFLWFEFFERILGLDKRKDELHHEKMRKERLKRNFESNKRR